MLEGCVWGARGTYFGVKSRQGNFQSRQQSAQIGPRDVPKVINITKNLKLRHLDFERPYLVLATFTAFRGTGAVEMLLKLAFCETYVKNAYRNDSQSHPKRPLKFKKPGSAAQAARPFK